MNPIEAAWWVLKNAEEQQRRQPQQPTITDFMGYTRPQLEQMLVMFNNELVRRGRAGTPPELENPTTDSSGLMTRLMNGESLSTAELLHLQNPSANPLPQPTGGEYHMGSLENDERCSECGDRLDDTYDCVNFDCENYSNPTRSAPNPHVVRARLSEMGVPEEYIQDEHIRQYQDFMRNTGRHPTEDEVNTHIG